MSSDDESVGNLTVERETQFVPRSDDEEVLWEVQEITAERGKKYKVKWVGIDPATNKPWAQSWVDKHDCTDRLVAEWEATKKKKLAAKKKRESAKSRASVSSKTSGASSSKTRPSAAPKRLSSRLSLNDSDPPTPPPKKPPTKRKRQSEIFVIASGDEEQVEEQRESPRPRKKRKSNVEVEVPLPSFPSDLDELPSLEIEANTPPRHRAPSLSIVVSSDEDEVLVPISMGTAIRSQLSDVEQELRRPNGKGKTIPAKTTAEKNSVRSEVSQDYERPLSKSKIQATPRRRSPSEELEAQSEEEGEVPEDRGRRWSKSEMKVTPRRKSPSEKLEAQSEEEGEISEGYGRHSSKSKIKASPRRKTPSEELKAQSEEEGEVPEDYRRHSSKSNIKATPRRKLPSEALKTQSEEEVEAAISPPAKVGPPRGAKRQGKRKLVSPSKGPFERFTPRKGSPPSVQKAPVKDHTVPPARPRQISIPKSMYGSPHSPELSPGARARLELFDRMMSDPSQPEIPPSLADVYTNVADDMNYDSYDPPNPPPASHSKPKPSILDPSNGLVVPETESSGNSQSQSQPFPKPTTAQPPQVHEQSSLRNNLDLPAIAIISVSTASSSIASEEIPPPNRPSKPHPLKRKPIARKSAPIKALYKPVPQLSPNTFRSKLNQHSRVADAEAPPSSIESFPSPVRGDKGRRRAMEHDELRSDSSDEDQEQENGRRGTRMTDSELRTRGKELFDQAQHRRELERERGNVGKRLKNVGDIVKARHPSSPRNGTALPFTGEVDNALESVAQGMEDVFVDFSGGGNSTTIDTLEHSDKKVLTEEERAVLRIQLRREEEENTQEAMDARPRNGSPSKKFEQVSKLSLDPGPSKNSLPSGPMEDVEHPSTELQRASVIVQASQGQWVEDTDVEILDAVQEASSPARPVLDNLSDSPKRRLGKVLSLLNVKSEEIQRLERELANEQGNVQKLKEELAKLRLSPEKPPQPTSDDSAAREAERAQWSHDRSKWETDRTNWEVERREWFEERAAAASEAVARAERGEAKWQQLHSQFSNLEVERDRWIKEREKMNEDAVHVAEELAVLTRQRDEHNQDRTTWGADREKWEADRAAWAEEKAGWESERTALKEEREALSRSVAELTASVEVLTAAKVSADKDCDFFREQYTRASAFVGSISDENKELENKAKIAEGQAQEGVAMIKALFENRVKALQDDIQRWKSLAELLQEKDKRTNDDIRLRAAEAPELEERCRRFADENSTLEIDLRKLGQAQQRVTVQRNKLYHEVLMLKKERASLRLKLSQIVKATGTSTQETLNSVSEDHILPSPEGPEIMDPNDMEILSDSSLQLAEISFDDTWFPCMWRPHFRDRCQQIFDSKEDLERHLQEHFHDLTR